MKRTVLILALALGTAHAEDRVNARMEFKQVTLATELIETVKGWWNGGIGLEPAVISSVGEHGGVAGWRGWVYNKFTGLPLMDETTGKEVEENFEEMVEGLALFKKEQGDPTPLALNAMRVEGTPDQLAEIANHPIVGEMTLPPGVQLPCGSNCASPFTPLY